MRTGGQNNVRNNGRSISRVLVAYVEEAAKAGKF